MEYNELIVRLRSNHDCSIACDAFEAAAAIEVLTEELEAALRAQQENEKNDPLTLDELRQMDGEPVRHGRWENGCVCSNCTTHFGPKNNAAALYYRYRPFCGARMDASEQPR